jgi:hypothetical protein
MNSTISDQLITDRVRAVDFQQWRAKVYASGGCANPIKLIGSGSLVNPDGTVLYTRSGELFAPCGNRRDSVRPACSDRYAGDAFHLIRAGLSGGLKQIPTSVTEKPRVFLTSPRRRSVRFTLAGSPAQGRSSRAAAGSGTTPTIHASGER